MEAKNTRLIHETGWQYVSDMIRATITVNSIPELWDAYKGLKDSEIFEVIDLKESLSGKDKRITVTFDFGNKIIGEIEFRYEAIPI